MGLDMYLKAQKYMGAYSHRPEEEKEQVYAVLTAAGLPKELMEESSPSIEVSVTVAYWRKANAIHKWFVDNTQDGVDNCQESYVSREQLQELLHTCRHVLSVAKIAPPPNEALVEVGLAKPQEGRALLNGEEVAEILPSASGFFFGSTEYGEWYLQDIEETIGQLERVLRDVPDRCDFYYRASW